MIGSGDARPCRFPAIWHRTEAPPQDASMSTQQVLAAPPERLKWRTAPSRGREHLHGTELWWAMAFLAPYLAVLIAFALYPFLYGLWMAGDPALYAELFEGDEYWDTLANTVIYVGLGVNLNMLLALALSGFFMRRRWWIKALLVLSMLPWALPAQVAFISFHWMLIYPGFIDSLCWRLFGIDGPDWFHYYWSALAANIIAYTWKTLPFWTLILLAGRMAIPQDLYDAAEVDGADSWRRFRYVVGPLLANLYIVCTLLCTIWMLGDFNTPEIVSGGAPDGSTAVLATLGVDYLMEKGKPALGAATVISALPLLIPVGLLLVRRLRAREVQL
jgi:multiple sugar transport system permease protein